MRERLRYMHYSLRTEQTYLYGVRWFIRFHGLRHQREMGRPEVVQTFTSGNEPALNFGMITAANRTLQSFRTDQP
jgi:hypothetical protein